jgi:putative tryptophan/tyrosine transport system substrate-binding protein
MKSRREFITLLGGAAVAWPLAARAQQRGKLPTIGFLGVDATAWAPWTAAFVSRLRQLGWIEGRTIAIEYRWSEGRPERNAEIAVEFVRLKVDVILTAAPAVAILQQATAIIPIVFPIAVDPVGGGLVASLARPGGNVTGLSLQSPDLASKRVELLREVIPRLRRLAVLADVGYPAAVLELGEVQAAARTLGLEVAPLEIRRAEDIALAFEQLKAQRDTQADALYVVGNALTVANRTRINTLTLTARLPTMFSNRDQAQSVVSCHTGQISRTCSGAPAKSSIKFCAAQIRPTSRLSSRPSSSWWSISLPPRRSVSKSRRCYSPAPTR